MSVGQHIQAESNRSCSPVKTKNRKRTSNDLKNYQAGTTHDELSWMDVSVHACKLLNSFEKIVFFTPDQLMFATDVVDRAKNGGYDRVTIPESIREENCGYVDASRNIIRDLGARVCLDSN